MLPCRACTRRALTVLLEHVFPLDAGRPTFRNSLQSDASRRTRTYTTTSVAISSRNTITRSDPTRNHERESGRGIPKSTELAVKKQLKYLDDPLFIAQQVERTLTKGRFEEAALLVRNASKLHNVAVSWNHLIDYQLRNHRLNAALKLFNEMKKRAQLPNAQTYTIIFRGCASSPHTQLAVKEAVNIYNNMLASDRLRPNSVHMNAVLEVCARAEDIDSMFSVIRSANEGLRAPNNLTYTTVINALRAKVDKRQLRDSVDPKVIEEREQAIQRAMAIWEEVLVKWRSAHIVVDEKLVCSMGRMLLLGDYHQNNKVFSLIEQTMTIPSEPTELGRLASHDTTADSSYNVNGSGKEPGGKSLAKVNNDSSNGHRWIYPKPGNNTLSLILSAVESTGKVVLARRYWTVLTEKYGVVPDAENWYALLRAFRRGKSSTKTVQHLAMIPKDMLSAKIFRTAMYTCLRDNLNKSAFNNATQVLEIMLTSLRIPDLQCLRNYLHVAYANKRLFEEMSKKDINGAKLAWGRQLSLALENIWEPYQIAAKQFTYGGLGVSSEKKHLERPEQGEGIPTAAWRADLVALARKMIAAHDRLIFGNLVPDSVANRIKPRRNALNAFVVKYFEDVKRLEPSGSHKVGVAEPQEEEEEAFFNTKDDESW